jgi:hypothetical protein
MFQNRSSIFQQNSAPVHKDKICNSGLKILYPNLLVLIIGCQPAQTLILSTTRCHHNLELLKQVLVKDVNNFPTDVFCTAIDEWPNKLQQCIIDNGGHFE